MEAQLNGSAPNPQPLVELNQFSEEQLRLIKEEICPGASNNELKTFLHVCSKRKLDPLSKQIYSLPGYGKSKNRTTIIGIDGQRAIGHRSGLVAGVSEALFDLDESVKSSINPAGLVSATVLIKKIIPGSQVIGEFTGTVYWTEYAPIFKDNLGHMWKKMPRGQLGKCAESAAWRKAFPEELGGMYIREEMDQAQTIPAQSRKMPPKRERETNPEVTKLLLEIQELAKTHCKDKSPAEKMLFMERTMKVSSFGELTKRPASALRKIIADIKSAEENRDTDLWWEPEPEEYVSMPKN